MTFIDGTVVNIALPTIGRDLHAGLAQQQWVMLSYSLAVYRFEQDDARTRGMIDPSPKPA